MAMLGYTNVHYIPIKKKGSIMRVPPGRKMQSGSGRRAQRGGDFWSDVSSFFAPVVSEVDDVLRETRVLSTVAAPAIGYIGGAVGSLADPFIGPMGTVAGGAIGAAAGKKLSGALYQRGYGKKRKGMKKKKVKRKK